MLERVTHGSLEVPTLIWEVTQSDREVRHLPVPSIVGLVRTIRVARRGRPPAQTAPGAAAAAAAAVRAAPKPPRAASRAALSYGPFSIVVGCGGGWGGAMCSCFVCSSCPSVASELSFDVRAGTRFPFCIAIQTNTKIYSYNCASLINIGTKSGVGDSSGLPRQPIRPTGELAGRRGDELVVGINDRILIQNYT